MSLMNRATLLEYHGSVEEFIHFHEAKAKSLEVDHRTLLESKHSSIFIPKVYQMGVNNLGINKILNESFERIAIEIEKQLGLEYDLVEQGKKMLNGTLDEIQLSGSKY